MEFEKVEPKQDDWKEQYNLTAYDGEHLIASLIKDSDNDWNSVIDGVIEWIDFDCGFEHAKEQFIDCVEDYLIDQKDHYDELLDMLDDLN